jgi:general secretion pathway protein D
MRLKKMIKAGDFNLKLLMAIALVALFSSGCVSTSTVKPTSTVLVKTVSSETNGQAPAEGVEKKADSATEELKAPLSKESPTSDLLSMEHISPLKSASKVSLTDTRVGTPSGQDKEKPIQAEFVFDNADLHDVLDIVLYEHFKVDYMIDPSIRAKVSFHISGEFTEKDVIDRLNSVLQMSSLAMVQGPGGILKIVHRKDAPGGSDFGRSQAGESAGDITQLIRVRYMSAPEAANKVKPFLSKSASVITDIMNNSLVITDMPENIDNAAAILGLMDVPFFKDLSWKIIPVKESDSEDIVKDIEKILKTQGFYSRAGMSAGGYHILPLKTINAVFVLSKWPRVIKIVENWIAVMDQADDSSTDVFVYFVENSSAVDLADILKQVYGGKKSKEKKQTIVKADTKKVAQVSGELTGEVEIIPDEITNAIVFKASRKDYAIIKKVLTKLDIVSRQVLLNVVIAEVTLENSTEYGVQWFLENGIGDYSGHAMLDINESVKSVTTGLGSSSKFSYALFNSSDVLKGLVTALGKDSEVNILSTPNVLALDNKEAEIEVGEDVPTITGSVTDSTGSGVTNTVQYKKTGIILTVTPHINSSGIVKLELVQEVSEKGTLDKQLNNYSILNRKVSTSLVVDDGQTIFMGGMMRYNKSTSDAGIPFLKDIPFIGYLFKNGKDELKKTELVFLITPHVVRNRGEANKMTEEFSKNIDSITRLLEDQKN